MKKLLTLLFTVLTGTVAFAQNVGINELSPSAKLEVKGTGISSATTAFQVKNSSSALIMKVRDDGNIGLGYGTPSFRLDVQGRMRVRSTTGDIFNSAGIWLDDYRDNSNAAFIGMMDSTRVGFWGQKGAGWQWNYDTKNGNVGMGMLASTGSTKLSINDVDGARISLFTNGSSRGGLYATDSTLELSGATSLNLFCFPVPCPSAPPKDLIIQPACPPGITCLYSRGNVGFFVNKPKADMHVGGNVLIGASTSEMATGYKLSVDGKVICEELKVQTSGAWPDYVFEDDYNLPSLETIEAKVMSEKHLPGIPSAADVKAQQGIELGDMQKRMLEKMEEMYRYMFQINNQNKALKAEVSALKIEVQQIKK